MSKTRSTEQAIKKIRSYTHDIVKSVGKLLENPDDKYARQIVTRTNIIRKKIDVLENRLKELQQKPSPELVKIDVKKFALLWSRRTDNKIKVTVSSSMKEIRVKANDEFVNNMDSDMLIRGLVEDIPLDKLSGTTLRGNLYKLPEANALGKTYRISFQNQTKTVSVTLFR